MCGIVGVINRESIFKDKSKLTDWFKEALYCDALRGKHGTGIVGVNSKGEISIHKKALASSDFLELKATSKIIEGSNIFLIGHNRYATKGSHTADNSHPFNHGSITLVHNGTINNYMTLNKGSNSFEVDSDSLTYFLSKSEDIKESLEEIKGAYSLVWYDELTESINFARNDSRPMFLGNVKGSNSIVFASERGMLTWLASRNQIELADIVSLKPGIWLSIPLNDKEEVSSVEFDHTKSIVHTTYDYSKYMGVTHNSKAKNNNKDNSNQIVVHKKESSLVNSFIKVVLTKWVPYNNTTSMVKSNGYMQGKWGDYTVILPAVTGEESIELVNTMVKTKIVTVNDDDKKIYVTSLNMEVVTDELPTLLKGPNNVSITHSKYDELTKYGCSHCSCDLPRVIHKSVVWDSQSNPMCEECSEILTII